MVARHGLIFFSKHGCSIMSRLQRFIQVVYIFITGLRPVVLIFALWAKRMKINAI
jgi:hypothetical protein